MNVKTIKTHCDMLLLDTSGNITPADQNGPQLRTAVLDILGTAWAIPEDLPCGLVVWHDMLASLNEPLVMNIPAMWLIQQRCGSFGAHMIYGNVVITGRDSGGNPIPLSDSLWNALRRLG